MAVLHERTEALSSTKADIVSCGSGHSDWRSNWPPMSASAPNCARRAPTLQCKRLAISDLYQPGHTTELDPIDP